MGSELLSPFTLDPILQVHFCSTEPESPGDDETMGFNKEGRLDHLGALCQEVTPICVLDFLRQIQGELQRFGHRLQDQCAVRIWNQVLQVVPAIFLQIFYHIQPGSFECM